MFSYVFSGLSVAHAIYQLSKYAHNMLRLIDFGSFLYALVTFNQIECVWVVSLSRKAPEEERGDGKCLIKLKFGCGKIVQKGNWRVEVWSWRIGR